MAISTATRMWDPPHETMERAALRALQLERVQRAVRRAYAAVPFYRERLDAAGVTPDSIRTLDDVRRLPFTVKDHLREAYPYKMLAVPLNQVVRIHTSSGTTGKPTTCAYTAADLNIWTECVARIIAAGGVGPGDVLQVAFGYGLFTGGLGLHYGGERVGAVVIPAAAGTTGRQIELMQDFGTTALACTPSYALYMCDVIDELKVDRATLKLRVGFFGAEPMSDRAREEIEQRLGIVTIDNYGLSEVIGPGVSFECLEQNGQHINEDHFLAEVIDPDTEEVLPDGEEGELVLTTLSKEAMPLLRYRTRDLTRIHTEPCPCGRTLRRMARVRHRSDDMVIVRGVNIYPSQIASILGEFPELSPHFLMVVDHLAGRDSLEVQVEEVAEMSAATRVDLCTRITRRMQTVLSLTPIITPVSPKTLERTQAKAKRVVDKRQVDS